MAELRASTRLAKGVAWFAVALLAFGLCVVLLTGCALPNKPPPEDNGSPDEPPATVSGPNAWPTADRDAVIGGTTFKLGINSNDSRPIFWWYEPHPDVQTNGQPTSGTFDWQFDASIGTIIEAYPIVLAAHFGVYDIETGQVALETHTLDLMLVPVRRIVTTAKGAEPNPIYQGQTTELTIAIQNQDEYPAPGVGLCLENWPSDYGTLHWRRPLIEGEPNIYGIDLEPGEMFIHKFGWTANADCPQGQHQFVFNVTKDNGYHPQMGSPTITLTVLNP